MHWQRLTLAAANIGSLNDRRVVRSQIEGGLIQGGPGLRVHGPFCLRLADSAWMMIQFDGPCHRIRLFLIGPNQLATKG